MPQKTKMCAYICQSVNTALNILRRGISVWIFAFSSLVRLSSSSPNSSASRRCRRKAFSTGVRKEEVEG